MSDDLPPFGEGRLAARRDREARAFEEAERRYAEYRRSVVQAIIDAARANHDPGDEDRS